MAHLQFIQELFQTTFLLSMPGGDEITTTLTLIVVGLIAYAAIKATKRSIRVVHAHWHHMFDTRPFASKEFYEYLKNGIVEKGIEGISFKGITHSERGILSAQRVYLRINYREYMIDICAAPFAKDAFFVSWWLGDAGITFRDFLISIPVIGRLFNRREKTFYEQDTEIMFKEIVSGCVKDTIEKLTEEKGQRINIPDWKGSDIKFNTK
jgi:hypothetical protein